MVTRKLPHTRHGRRPSTCAQDPLRTLNPDPLVAHPLLRAPGACRRHAPPPEQALTAGRAAGAPAGAGFCCKGFWPPRPRGTSGANSREKKASLARCSASTHFSARRPQLRTRSADAFCTAPAAGALHEKVERAEMKGPMMTQDCKQAVLAVQHSSRSDELDSEGSRTQGRKPDLILIRP